MRRVFAMATAGTLVMVVGTGSLQAQSLTSVPDNAAVFVKIKNLQDVSKKLGVLFQQWGLAAMQPALADPLASFQGIANIQEGLKTDGEAGLVVFSPTGARGEGEPYILMLPVSDFAAFVKNLPDAAAEGEITSFTMPMNQDMGYVTKWGSFAAISPNKTLISARPQASKPTGLTGQQFMSRDIVAYVNFNSFRNQAAAGLGFGRMMLAGQMEQTGMQQPDKAKYMPLAKVAVNQLFNGLDHFINETQAITVGIDLSDKGIQVTSMSEFMPDTYLGKLTSQWKAAPAPAGAALPDGKYAMVGGVSFDAATLNQIVDEAAAPIIAEAKNLGDEAKPFIDYIDAMKAFWQSAKSQSFAISPGTGKAGESALFEINLAMQGDAKGIIAAQNKMASLQDEFTKIVQMPGQPTSSIEIKKAAKTVDGVALDEMTTSFQGVDADDPQMKMIDMLYGKGGLTMLMGPVDAQTVIATTSRDDAGIKSLITAAKGQTNILATQAPTKQVSGNLPANAFASFYVYGDQVLALASRASEAFAGTPLQVQLPPNSEPLGAAISTEGTAVRMDLYVPSQLVQSSMAAALQEAMHQQKKMNQGGGL